LHAGMATDGGGDDGFRLDVGEHIIERGHRYEVMEVLGSGGSGYVYKVRDLDMGREALSAIKVLIPPARRSGAEYERQARAWRNEVKRATDIKHDNIVKVIDCGIDEERGWPMHFLKMELLEGMTLKKRLSDGRLGLRETLVILLPCLDAVEKLHDCGLIHRDLKPANIFLHRPAHGGEAEIPKILDFGLCHTNDPEMSSTLAGSIAGTPPYMCRRQLQGGRPSAQFDIHALGVILYESLAGQRPFSGATADELLASIAEGAVPLLQRCPELDPRVGELVQRALCDDSEAWFKHVRELATGLEQLVAARRSAARSPLDVTLAVGSREHVRNPCRASTPEQLTPGLASAGVPSPPRRRRAYLAIAAGVGAGVVLGAGIAAPLLGERKEAQHTAAKAALARPAEQGSRRTTPSEAAPGRSELEPRAADPLPAPDRGKPARASSNKSATQIEKNKREKEGEQSPVGLPPDVRLPAGHAVPTLRRVSSSSSKSRGTRDEDPRGPR
jgi:serine/threonine protein kinase